MDNPGEPSSVIEVKYQGIAGFLIDRHEGDITIVDVSEVLESASGG